MQARRDKHPLYTGQRMRLYAFAFMALHKSGERALGASYVSSDRDDVAEQYAYDHALKELPPQQGFRDRFVSVYLIDDRNIEAIVQGPRPQTRPGRTHVVVARSQENDDGSSCKNLGCIGRRTPHV